MIKHFYLTPADGSKLPEAKAGQYISVRLPMPGEEYLMNRQYYIPLAVGILVLILVEWINRTKEHGLAAPKVSKLSQLLVYYILVTWVIISMYINQKAVTFIYFQF